ncbi:DNA mismatch repair protein MutS [Desulfuromusa kysingii]|uniref:DNA mismatch repair protein MutS n=1 Tax=Desulfuromusa kysingii TaxID=37625 RepID=A0A1H4D0H8_9BACT|nr:DNA mismatch repair protein MutS [Desulfuromusa kysingii]SEA66137.1 DNA mismatch repair protein MutS [Desulfuromusa kysingii]
MSTTTPVMRQYLEIKADYQDAILFFRLGDFYEMFMEDAVLASRVLGITLTSRNKGVADAVPLCGVPYHSSQGYISKLIAAGHKVAICEQVENPKTAKGIVKREVVRVVTPGLVTDTETLEPKENNYLLAIVKNKDSYGLAHIDITTGEFRVTEVETLQQIESELGSLRPREVLFSDSQPSRELKQQIGTPLDGVMCSFLPEWVCEEDYAQEQLCTFFGVTGLQAFGCHELLAAQQAASVVLYYLHQTQKEELHHIQALQTYHPQNYMVLDDSTRRNLELTATLQDGKKRGSLLGVLDRTMTAMGGRTLRHWIHYPLIDQYQILQRQRAIAELVDDSLQRLDLIEALDGVYDLERLNSKIAMASANAKDLVALRSSLGKLPRFEDLLSPLQSEYLTQLRENIDLLPELVTLLDQAITDDPPFVLRDGGIIKDGFNEELDELRVISRDGKSWIAALEQQERERTGIPTLKVKYNKVFGYFIEVTHRNLDRVPDEYHRKQTLTNAERFITPQLKEYEDKILGAEDRIVELEYNLFQQIRLKASAEGRRIQQSADILATLDALLSLADLAHERNYVCPQIDESGAIYIEGGRHPVVEGMPLKEAFVPNDVELDTETNQLLIVTGPNMAGKSTFMRQVALITLMAQLGSFVPAEKARIGVVDRIFTRVGANDNLAKGESTFMVEMNETANILRHATQKSLIILDEIGRGTSTFDGVSIAWAVAEYLHDNPKIAAKTLFATHYHELTDLPLTRERVKNYNVAVKEWNDQIIFLRKIIPGSASRSYGIQVGRLAGLPDAVITRAKEILHNLEAGEFVRSGEPRLGEGKNKLKRQDNRQMSLFQGQQEDKIRMRLEALDVSSTTPIEALTLLDELKKML